MANNTPPQPRYLTLTELVFSYGLFCGVGYLVGGSIGAWCGAGLVTARYAQLIWLSSRGPDQPAADAEPSAVEAEKEVP